MFAMAPVTISKGTGVLLGKTTWTESEDGQESTTEDKQDKRVYQNHSSIVFPSTCGPLYFLQPFFYSLSVTTSK